MQIKKLEGAINILRELDPDMPMSTLVTFLRLADGQEIEVRNLQEKLDLSISSLNRALTYLGDHPRAKKGGLGLVDQKVSPEDRRVRIANLSVKGRLVIDKIEGEMTK